MKKRQEKVDPNDMIAFIYEKVNRNKKIIDKTIKLMYNHKAEIP